ncbi:ABC transporter permease [Salinarimonas chemoclinalis]|uniref:ABC transporter permease n=1 Tax=Salinarimonas chemoclinalis TaxID=3241599 RepID=UPI003558C061
MTPIGFFEIVGFGERGWGPALLLATSVTLAVAVCGFLVGSVLGALAAAAKLSRSRLAATIGDTYTTVLRGIPDLLVIYLFYFGGSLALTNLGRMLGYDGFLGLPVFVTGALAIGVVNGAYQAEVFRGAYLSLSKGELEAARSVGMSRALMFRRIVVPQVMRYAIPGLGNVWQLALKESALISVIGLVELLRQAQIGAGSTRQPFYFFLAAAILYLALTTISTIAFQKAENRAMRGVRRAA